MKHVEEFVLQDTKFNGEENSETALKLLKQQHRLSTALLYSIKEDHTENVPYFTLRVVVHVMDSLVVQLLLPPTVQLISAKAGSNIAEQTMAEL